MRLKENQGEDFLKILFNEHKILTIKQLNWKWDILSLESYIDKKIIPQGLWERVTPAEHLQNERFLTRWKQTCIEIMKLIVEKEVTKRDPNPDL